MKNRPISSNPTDPDLYEFICLLGLMACLGVIMVLALAYHLDVRAFLDATIFPEVTR